MSINQILAIFKARWLLFAAILGVTVVAAAVVTVLLPKQYTASASVVIDLKSPDPVAGMMMPGMLAPSYMATQVDIIQSERVARKVIAGLRLAENPDTKIAWEEATEGRGTVEDWLTTLLLEKLEVSPSRESNVLRLSYAAADPRFAAVIANAFVQAYIQTVLELRTEPASQFNAMFENQAQQAQVRLEKAKKALADYQRATGIISIDERMDVENARLAELSSQLVGMQSIAAESRYRAGQASNNAERAPEVVNNALVAGLRADKARQESKLQELQARFGEAHPLVVETKASIAELTRRIGLETNRVAQSMGVNSSINQAREAQIREALANQRQKILDLKDKRAEMDSLLREVDSAQRAIDGLQSRLNQTDLERQATRTNVSVLKSASEPIEPSSPKTILNIFLAIFVGGAMGLLVIFGLEFVNRKLRTENDLDGLVDLPFLGVMPDAKNLGNLPRPVSPVGQLLSLGSQPRLTSSKA
ncbi:chain length determinant protein EpsF [Aquabacterium sp. A3]|uniref:chain length determinant protein EpsF n=1 Tax=Aquabacterium sp. A3 TaxID=3132829 RepID=UPI0031197A2D